MPEFIKDLKDILSSHSALIDAKKSLHVLFNKTSYGCKKDYPVAVVDESKHIKEEDALAYFKENYLLDEQGLSYEEYPSDDITRISKYTPKYIQNVGFVLAKHKRHAPPYIFQQVQT